MELCSSSKLLAAMPSDREIRANTEIRRGRNRTKIRLGEICQISPRHLHFQPKERVEGGLFTEYWLSHQSRLASQEGDENVFSKTGRWSKCGSIRMRRCGKLSLRWPIWEPRMDQQLIRGEIYQRSVLQCAVLCLLLCTVTSPLSPRAPIGCLKHSRILSRRIAGSIFMPFQLIRPGNILTAISSPSHAASHLYQLPSHTNGIGQTSQPCLKSTAGALIISIFKGHTKKRKQPGAGIFTDDSIQEESDSSFWEGLKRFQAFRSC